MNSFEVIKLNETNKNSIIEGAMKVLLNNEILIFPTDTVYGLCGLLTEAPIKKLFSLKQRKDKQVPILFSSLERVMQRLLKTIPDWFIAFAEKFWPGAYTLILESSQKIKGISDDGYIGIRQPDHPELLQVIEGVGGFIAATSANISGAGTGTDFEEIRDTFSTQVPLIVEGDISHANPSVVLKFHDEQVTILRSSGEINKVKDFFNLYNLEII